MAEYEITEIEFAPKDGDNWNVCQHCGRLVAYHLQKADGRMFCIASAVSIECGCPARTCQPEGNIGRFCWRTGCPIYARDFQS